MTVAEAARTFEEHKAAYDELRAKMDAATDVLKAYFRRTKRSRRGRVGFSRTPYQRLDTKAVRAHLGEDVAGFLVPSWREQVFLVADER